MIGSIFYLRKNPMLDIYQCASFLGHLSNDSILKAKFEGYITNECGFSVSELPACEDAGIPNEHWLNVEQANHVLDYMFELYKGDTRPTRCAATFLNNTHIPIHNKTAFRKEWIGRYLGNRPY